MTNNTLTDREASALVAATKAGVRYAISLEKSRNRWRAAALLLLVLAVVLGAMLAQKSFGFDSLSAAVEKRNEGSVSLAHNCKAHLASGSASKPFDGGDQRGRATVKQSLRVKNLLEVSLLCPSSATRPTRRPDGKPSRAETFVAVNSLLSAPVLADPPSGSAREHNPASMRSSSTLAADNFFHGRTHRAQGLCPILIYDQALR